VACVAASSNRAIETRWPIGTVVEMWLSFEANTGCSGAEFGAIVLRLTWTCMPI